MIRHQHSFELIAGLTTNAKCVRCGLRVVARLVIDASPHRPIAARVVAVHRGKELLPGRVPCQQGGVR